MREMGPQRLLHEDCLQQALECHCRANLSCVLPKRLNYGGWALHWVSVHVRQHTKLRDLLVVVAYTARGRCLEQRLRRGGPRPLNACVSPCQLPNARPDGASGRAWEVERSRPARRSCARASRRPCRCAELHVLRIFLPTNVPATFATGVCLEAEASRRQPLACETHARIRPDALGG